MLLEVATGSRRVTDLTGAAASFVRSVAADGASGLLHVFAPHATCGVALMELGSGSEADLSEALDRLLPRDERWVHRHGSTGHGADHVLPVFVPPALTVPVVGGAMALGTWQSLVLVDTNGDNPVRSVRLSFLAG